MIEIHEIELLGDRFEKVEWFRERISLDGACENDGPRFFAIVEHFRVKPHTVPLFNDPPGLESGNGAIGLVLLEQTDVVLAK